MEQFLVFVNVLLGFVPAVAGAAVAIAVLVDGLKKLGWLPDGYAPLASGVLNLAVFVALFFLGDQYGKEVQSVLDGIAIVAPVLVSLLIALLSTSKAHDLFNSIGLGYSYSDIKSKARAG
jgi:hypothetical protein